MSLFKELKRRHVIRVAGLYLVAAWLAVQVAGTVLPIFAVPDWVLRAVVVALAIGFVPAMMVAWVFESTPGGVKREDAVPEGSSIAPATAKRMSRAIVALLLAALAYLAFDKFVLAPRPGSLAETVDTHATSMPVAAVPAHPPLPAGNTIAVLPFVNMSSDLEQEYFSDGLSEELLNLLAQVPELRVTARTSSFSFKGKDADVAAIARALNVAHVLEGSVRRSGDTLRITAQLIRTSDSSHLWSQAFDRQLTDIFQVQDEIARAVVEALKLKLLPQQGFHSILRSDVPEAYTRVLEGFEMLRGESELDARRAIALFERALALDPDYAGAHSGLASAYFTIGNAVGGDEYPRRSQEEAEACIALAPDQAACYIQRGLARINFHLDWAGAKADIDRATALPHGGALQNLAFRYLVAHGQRDEAIALLRHGVAENPLNGGLWTQLGRLLNAAGELDEAHDILRQALALNPGSSYVRFHLGANRILQGHAQDALALNRDTDSYGLVGTALAEHALGHTARAQAALDTLIREQGHAAAYQIAEIHAWRGETDAAFAWLQRAFAQKDGGLVYVQVDPFLASLVDDPRYAALLGQMGLERRDPGAAP